MSPNIQIEARLLVLSMGLGAGLMASYDVLRLLRLMVRHSWLAIGLEDLVYWYSACFTRKMTAVCVSTLSARFFSPWWYMTGCAAQIFLGY